MKNFILWFSIFLITIIISLYFQKSNHEEFNANIDPGIVTSNIEEGNGLSKNVILSQMTNVSQILNNNMLTGIKITATSDNKPITPTGVPLTGFNSPLYDKTINDVTKISINGKPMGTVADFYYTILQLIRYANFVTLNCESIDITYSNTVPAPAPAPAPECKTVCK